MPRGRMGGRHGMSTEKAKDFKGTMKKLMGYLTQYKIGLLLVVIFAIGSTIFNIAGPKIILIYPGIHYDRSFPETDLQNEKRDFGKD